MDLLVGCYTPDTGGHGPGVSTVRLDGATGELTVVAGLAVPSPSFLGAHPTRPVVYACHELPEGRVSALRRDDDGRLTQRSEHETGGAEPCHLAVSADGRMLYVANYGGGSLAAFRLDDDGQIVARTDLVRHERVGGPGPVADRQDAAHVHMAVPGPAIDLVSAVDLGTDRVVTYRVSGEGRLTETASSELPPGTGPRQLHALGDPAADGSRWTVLAGELDGRVHLAHQRADGLLRLVDSHPAVAEPVPSGVAVMPAQVLTGPDGTVQVSVRGADRVAVFRIDADRLVPVTDVPVGASWPRHMAAAGHRLVVAAERGDRLSTVDVAADGTLRPGVARLEIGNPACVLPLV